jgi:hypothetical protein
MGDIVGPLLWRMDETWRATRDRTPWVKLSPIDYDRRNVRYIAHSTEGPTDESEKARYWDAAGVAGQQMYASNYPSWDILRPDDAVRGIDPGSAEAFLSGNAAEWYGLEIGSHA